MPTVCSTDSYPLIVDNTAESLLVLDRVSIGISGKQAPVVSEASFSVKRGTLHAIVGESGSGKSLTARAILGLLPETLLKQAGRIVFDREDLSTMEETRLRRLRGSRIGMVFQEPMTSLNPSMKVGAQLLEALALHRPELSRTTRRDLAMDMLTRVGIKQPEVAMTAWPHEFSGGMRQRLMLASVMLLRPILLIADEPTTALDAIVQRDVLDIMTELTRESGTTVLLISHDLPMVARYANSVTVMERGRVVESGDTESVMSAPREAYTRKLLLSLPARKPTRTLAASKPIVEVRDLIVDYDVASISFRKKPRKRALRGVSLTVMPGETVAIVGESGSGKSTLSRVIAGLVRATSGELLYKGMAVERKSPMWKDYRLNCQMVFQDPNSSLDPRMTVAQLIGEALRHMKYLTAAEQSARVESTVLDVGLSLEYLMRYPHQLSGGQRQRVAIARAVVRRPDFVIADEPVSALDVTVRAQILELFSKLQAQYGFSCLFVSHDLAVVEQIADRVIVMKDGKIVEEGTRDCIFDTPVELYTKSLLTAIPHLEQTDTGGVRIKWRQYDSSSVSRSSSGTL